MLRGLVWPAVGLLLLGAFVFTWVKLAPRRVPDGQARLASLDRQSLPVLRDAFNAAAGEVRILALLSPT